MDGQRRCLTAGCVVHGSVGGVVESAEGAVVVESAEGSVVVEFAEGSVVLGRVCGTIGSCPPLLHAACSTRPI